MTDYGVIVVTRVRDGRVYEWQGPPIARIPKPCFDQEFLPALERGELPWDFEILGVDWSDETVTIRKTEGVAA